MPLKLLHELSLQRLPALISDACDVVKLARLRQLGLVIVLLPDVPETEARVLLITAEGWRTVRKLTRLPERRASDARY